MPLRSTDHRDTSRPRPSTQKKPKSAFRKAVDQLKINMKEKDRKKKSKYFKSNTVGARR